MKYKVGDKVKIREDLKVEHLYGGRAWVTQGMHDLGGKIATIVDVSEHEGVYCIDLDNSSYIWTPEMFEDVNKDVGKRIVIEVDEGKVIARCSDKTGVAKLCDDFYISAKNALEHLGEAEKPYAWLKEGVKYYIPQTIYTDLYDCYWYSADDFDKTLMKRGIVFKTKEEAIACAKKMLAAVKQEDLQ